MRTGDSGADAFHKGRSHEADGKYRTARLCYREAAEAGHRAAAVVLGDVLASEAVTGPDELTDVWLGEPWALEPAEKWWQRGIGGLDAGSARELGRQLDWDPDLVATEHGLRVAYEAGDVQAGYWLAALLEERGSFQDRGLFDDDDGWLREAGQLVDALWSRTSHTAGAIRRRSASRWYPTWLLRRDVSSGRVPWGIDSRAVRTNVYAMGRRVRRGQTAGSFPRDYPIRFLRRARDGGDLEATFLLGMLGDEPETEACLRSAAEAGHRQAAFELGAIRAESADHEGAAHWFGRAAQAGHPGASFQLAWQWCATDPPAAEAACRKAARAGNLRAGALLRVLARGSGTPAPNGSRDDRVAELLAAWDELSGLAPAPDRCVDFLSERSGLPRADIARAHQVRDQCAHPAGDGSPSAYELDIALTTAAALHKRMGLDST